MQRFWKIAIVSLLTTSTGWALPSYDAPWPKVTLNGSQQNWLRDAEDENLIWLLPPANGTITVKDAKPSDHANHKLCSQLQGKLTNLHRSHTEFRDYLAYIKAAHRRVSAVLFSVNRHAAAIVSWQQRAEVNLQLAGLWRQRENHRRERDYLAAKLQRCTVADYCQRWDHHVTIAETLLADARHSYKAYSSKHPGVHKELAALSADLADATSELERAQKELSSYRRHIIELDTLLTKAYRRMANRQGGKIAVSYQLGHQEVLAEMAKQNPGYRFKMVPLSQMMLFARMVPTVIDDYYLASLPTFLGFNSPDMPTAKPGQWLGHGQGTALPKQIEGVFELTLHGACPLLDRKFFAAKGLEVTRNPLRDPPRNPLPQYAAVLQYHYPVVMSTALSVRFRYSELYDALRRHLATSDNGIITPHDVRELVATDALRPYIVLPDASPRQRDAITTAIIGQLLSLMTTPTLTLAGELAVPPAPPSSAWSGGSGAWHPVTGAAADAAYQRLAALPEQHWSFGPSRPIWLPALTQFGHFRLAAP